LDRTEQNRFAFSQKRFFIRSIQKGSDQPFGSWGNLSNPIGPPTHPLAYGYGDISYGLLDGRKFYNTDSEAVWNVEYTLQNEPENGFVGKNIKPYMKNVLLSTHYSKGGGEVVMFLNNPLMRAFWDGAKLKVANAIFMVR
jgi:hypothetical protein